jgi:NADH-quinone oxidoreductase subunit N
VGFYAKLSILQALVTTASVPYIVLAVFAVLTSLVGAFYYLRVVKTMWFDEPADTAPIRVAGDKNIVLGLNGLMVVVLGVIPGPLLDACMHAMSKTLAS